METGLWKSNYAKSNCFYENQIFKRNVKKLHPIIGNISGISA